MIDFSGKKFLVTGGSSGIGFQCASDLLKGGAEVVISGSNRDKLEDAHKRLSVISSKVHSVQNDLAVLEGVPALFDEALNIMGSLDGLICNAGITSEQLTIRVKLADWQRVIDINLTAAFALNHKACAHFMRQKHGKIVNMSSILAARGTVGQAGYCAAKGGLEALTRALAMEFGSRGININCIAPGFVETPMTEKMSSQHKEAAISAIPLGRIGSPSDISGAVLFLCSELSSYITGQVLHVNGGMFFG